MNLFKFSSKDNTHSLEKIQELELQKVFNRFKHSYTDYTLKEVNIVEREKEYWGDIEQ